MIYKKFNNLDPIIKVILLVVPFVNWITELVVRIDNALAKPEPVRIIMAVVVLLFGLPIGWIDVIWVLLYGHLIFAN